MFCHVISVIRIEHRILLQQKFTNVAHIEKIKKGVPRVASMTIEYLKCRVDLNFIVDFGSNKMSYVITWHG